MTKKLLELVGITDEFSRDVLLVAAYIRNSSHNNGIHRGRNLSISFQDLRFELVKDTKINCAGWGNIFSVLYETIKITDNILTTDVVKAIPTPFFDAYAARPP